MASATHNPDRVKPFACMESPCDKRFGRKHDLRRHIQSVHRTEKKFACEACSRDFSRKDTLRRHEDDGCPNKTVGSGVTVPTSLATGVGDSGGGSGEKKRRKGTETGQATSKSINLQSITPSPGINLIGRLDLVSSASEDMMQRSDLWGTLGIGSGQVIQSPIKSEGQGYYMHGL